jgi:hypothetical protein
VRRGGGGVGVRHHSVWLHLLLTSDQLMDFHETWYKHHSTKSPLTFLFYFLRSLNTDISATQSPVLLCYNRSSNILWHVKQWYGGRTISTFTFWCDGDNERTISGKCVKCVIETVIKVLTNSVGNTLYGDGAKLRASVWQIQCSRNYASGKCFLQETGTFEGK